LSEKWKHDFCLGHFGRVERMADHHFFTYDLLRNGKIVRRGKGKVTRRDSDAIASYLEGRYRERRWHAFTAEWHSSESAALKAEERKLEGYAIRMGGLPPWNFQRGGGGGTRYVGCRASLVRGRPCRNRAVVGYYGYCGVHGAR
jgi:hypothetical protein